MPKQERRNVFKRARQLGIRTYHFFRQMEKIFAAADLVVCMGGYNTLCEILSQGTLSLVIPRETPRKEQLIRAQAFQRQHLVDYISWDKFTTTGFARKIAQHAVRPRTLSPCGCRLQNDGHRHHAPTPAAFSIEKIMNRSGPPVLGIILKGYPRISETFISNEILLLEKLGFKIHLFSMRRGREAFTHRSVQQIKAPVDYLPETLLKPLPRLLRSNLALAARIPGVYQSRIDDCLATVAPDPQIRDPQAFIAGRLSDAAAFAANVGGAPACSFRPLAHVGRHVYQPVVGAAVQLHRPRQGHLYLGPAPAARKNGVGRPCCHLHRIQPPIPAGSGRGQCS